LKGVPRLTLKTAISAALLASTLAACGGSDALDTDPSDTVGPWRCNDFAWQDDAQAWYDKHPGPRPDLPPEYTLDPDGNGVACENLPPRPAGP
jgi:hypothetical protein